MDEKDEDFFHLPNLFEECISIDDGSSNLENRDQPFHRNTNRYPVQGSTSSWRNSNRTEKDFSRDAWRKTEYDWRNRDSADSRNDNVSRRVENDRSRLSRSTSGVPSYPRLSSIQRNLQNQGDRTNWRNRDSNINEKPAEFSFGKNRDESTRIGRSYESHRRNNYRSETPIQRNNKTEFDREKFIGYKYLKSLSEKESHEMICEILRPDANINVVLNRKELQADWMMLIVETIRKLCESDFKTNRAQVLQYFCESPLMDHISHYLGEVGMEKKKSTIENLNSFISNLVVFYSAVIKTIPTVAFDKNFDKFITKTKMGIDQMKIYLAAEIDESVVEKLSNLEEIMKDDSMAREKKVENWRRKHLDVGDLPPPDDFRSLSLYPTEEDLNRHHFGFVRPNKIKGSYQDVNHYLDVQFRLIREDFIDPLRRGLQNYKDAIALPGKPKCKYESVRLYNDVRIENIELTKQRQAAYVVNFNVNGRLRIKWEYSKRFMFGSLLLFTQDNFNSFFFATVFNRDIERLQEGRILVTLLGSEPLEPEMLNEPFIMAESEVYYEPYCLVMKALKEYSESDFPMKKFIVDGNTTVELPKYVINSQNLRIYDHDVNLVENNGWPNHSEIGFDQHQFDAFKTALSSNFTVIQGPPGTGKTYLGLKIVEVLLKNVTSNPDLFKTPILLVCYTNHALDQFLEGILKFTNSIVRVGGQSKSEALNPFNLRSKENLNELRREARLLFPLMNDCREEMKKIFSKLKEKIKQKEMIENPRGILSHRVLSDVMNPKSKQTIRDDEILLLWLLDMYDVPSEAQKNTMENIAKKINADSTQPIKNEIDEERNADEEDETAEADLLVNEDDVFQDQKEDPVEMSVGYCVTMENLSELFHITKRQLENLKTNRAKFEDYSEYYNCKYQLKENLRKIEHEYAILNHFMKNREVNSSSTKFITRDINLWDLPVDMRWCIYWTWVSQLKPIIEKELRTLEADYRSKSQQYEELKQMEDFHVVKNSLVVGMTTTCAARLQLLLKTLSPAIVIVEEAAEVLEAHIVVSLSKKCQHVILIGDHKQLKPSTAVYELSKKYNINVSLFERMINNNMYCPQLQIQHRMRPEISSLIVPSIYPELKNHESVLEYPSVKGITKNLFFVEHNAYEESVDDTSSRKNKFEAEFMIQLCRYILLQGYSEEQITILTTYAGQMFYLREMKRGYSILKNVKVVVVDKYQGEENDIILLSLVRSNEERKIGFLSIENRVCVALSRAKIGLYIIGNMDILSDSKLWLNIKDELVKQEAIGPKLTLYCDKHDVHTQVSCKSDFTKVLEGGCDNLCQEMMDCGHKCSLLCHKIDMEHLEKRCREKCLRRCVENHPCKKSCYLDCGLCTEPVERILPCEHKITLDCFINYQKYSCQEEVSVVLEHCSHEVKKKCFQSIDSVKCTFPCEDRLDCGHKCVNNCHKANDPDHLEYKCHKPCDKINLACSQQHECQRLCFEECGKCKVRVDFTLNCGHVINLECSANLDRIKCYRPCERKCDECNATCTKKCYEDCKPCKKKVTKTIPDCGHKKKMECSIVPQRILCVERCERMAPCGHECKSACCTPCGTDKCLEVVKSSCVEALCGHGYANVQCWRKDEMIDAEELLQYCTEPCNEVLKCGDTCAGTCGSCWQGRLHQPCKKKCGNVLVCGHSCTNPCRMVCPPCTRKCQYSCKHSKCPNYCGVPCVQCKEPCEWKCVHFKCRKKCGDFCNRPRCYEPCRKKLRCKHNCIGYCGEPCPPKCRICDEDEVTMIIFGNEDEPDARFVLLEDCGHVIESQAMDQFIDMAAEKGEILMKSCPLCKTPISKTLRYMNQVKQVYQNIQNVKTKIYGDEKEMYQIRSELMGKLRNLDLKNVLLSRKELLLIGRSVTVFRERLKNRGKKSYLSKQTLRAMHYFVDMFSSIISRLDDLKKCPQSEKLRIYNRLELILGHANPEALVINMQQVDEMHKELNRYHRIVDYIVYLSRQEYLYNRKSENVIVIDADIVDILYGLKCFDNEQDTRIGELFEKLREEMKVFEAVSQQDKRMIHEAMAKDFYGGINKQGHWFTCTNGHYYCITECGGAMEESNCPECGEKIGGRNHQYVETVRLASDMDGATRPAWSSGTDMRNFRI